MTSPRLIILVAALAACGDNAAPTAIADGIFGKLGAPLPSASSAQQVTFARGLAVGTRHYTPDDGLGPKFNVTFCLGCHEKPVFGGAAARYRDFNLVGTRLADGSFAGTGTNGVQDLYSIGEDARVATDPATNLIATRNPIAFFGAGVLAEISDEEILSRADPDDADHDGISGRANYDHGFVGRFGRKSQTTTVESFIRGPLFNHLGVTSDPLPLARRAALPVPSDHAIVPYQVGAPDMPITDDDGIPDPELSEDDLFDLVSFVMLTAAPTPSAPTPDSAAGHALFDQIACTGCHVATLRSRRGLIPAYTDLLVHDMGPDLADGVSQGDHLLTVGRSRGSLLRARARPVRSIPAARRARA